MKHNLDATNLKILRELVRNARIPLTELARKVGLSKTPVALRVKQMEDLGLITGYRTILSPLQLGLTHVTYVQARLSDTRLRALEEFNEAVHNIPEVEECYMIAGGFDYLLKIRSHDMADYRRIMGDHISALPHIHATTSFVAMEAVIEQGWTKI